MREQRSLEACLGISGLAVCTEEAGTGEEAVLLAHRHRPDVVILDHQMPRMTGLRALPLLGSQQVV